MTPPTSTPGAAWSPEPSVEIIAASPQQFAAAPLLNFHARITEPESREVYTVALNCQINIDPARRNYDDETRAALFDLFGEAERWGATTRSFMWTKEDVLVKSFTGEQTFDIPVACSFDTELAAVKYFYSVPEGDVPLTFVFSGTIFYRGEGGELKLVQVPWSCDPRFAMPVTTWRSMMDHYYPNRAWVAVQRETLEALRDFRQRRGLTSLDASVSELLADEHAGAKEGR